MLAPKAASIIVLHGSINFFYPFSVLGISPCLNFSFDSAHMYALQGCDPAILILLHFILHNIICSVIWSSLLSLVFPLVHL